MEWLIPEQVFLNGLRKPVDVVQALPDPLQALGPVSDAECQCRAGRTFFWVYCCWRLPPDRRLFVRAVFHACQAFRWKDPGRGGSVAVLIADAGDELQCRQIPSRRQTSEFHKSFSFLDRALSEPRDKRVFHSPTQDPAAQQQGV